MALGCLEIISNEIQTGVAAWVNSEGLTNGTSAQLIADLAPYPSGESNALLLGQSATQSYWRGQTYTIAAGDGFSMSLYVAFGNGSGGSVFPPTNDIPFFEIRTSGAAFHFQLKVAAGTSNVVVSDVGSGNTHTLTSAIAAKDRWHRIDLVVNMDNAANAEMEIQCVDTTNGNAVSGSISGGTWDFYQGTTELSVYLQGEQALPATITYTYIGSVLIRDGASTSTVQTSEWIGDYTCLIGQTSDADAAPDCDESGDTATLHSLDSGDWNDTADGDNTTWGEYADANDGGAVKMDHPKDDARMVTGVTRYGQSYIVRRQHEKGTGGNWLMIYGKLSSGTYAVSTQSYSASIVNTPEHVVLADGHANLPDVTSALEYSMLGFQIDTDRNGRCRQMWVAGAYAYPFAEREIAAGDCMRYVGRSNRIVV